MKTLWEILVPTNDNAGNFIPTEIHRQWDEKIRAISGGLTIYTPAKGQWVHQQKLFAERMIPVRFLATEDEVKEIISITMKFYSQKAVLAYEISNRVLLVHEEELSHV